MNLEFDLRLRLRLPEVRDLSLQSLYFFNLYRSGSSMVEAIAEALAVRSGRTPFNLSRDLYALGVEYFDSGDFRHSAVHIADPVQLTRLSDLGGYLFYGFREVPRGFAEVFTPLAASVLVVRDLRDIGISQYHAVAGHATDNRILAQQINALRAQNADIPLGDFLLRDDTVAFLTRIAEGYRPMIDRGVKVIRYEDMYSGAELDVERLCQEILGPMIPHLPADWDFADFLREVEQRIANSSALKGHSTGGSIYNWRKLDPELQAKFGARLKPSLELLGYDVAGSV